MVTITVPENYGYVLLAVSCFAWLNQWQSTLVGAKRRAAKVVYPQAYAEKAQQDASKEAHIFNCAQRAHQNTLEHLPVVLFSALFLGLKHPKVAAITSALWIVGRVLYTIGYISGLPKNRNNYGFLAPLSGLVLQTGATWAAIQMVMGK